MYSDLTSPIPLTQSNEREWLQRAGRWWLWTACAGQAVFVAYILLHYGGMLLEGGLAAWAVEGDNSYRAGDWLGNLAMASHIGLAVYILLGAPLQLAPSVRTRWPRLHRINGRLYIASVVLTSCAGLYVIWTRGTVGGEVMRWGISLDAVLIISFAFLAVRAAMQRRIDDHQRWVLRLFMAVSAVWFFRILFMLWMMLTGGAGINFEDFTGPFPYTLVFAQYLVPLALLECYFWVARHGRAQACLAMTAVVMVCTLLTLAGVAAASLGMWWPKIS